MVRHQLKKIEEYRGTFTGTFQRFGIKNGWHGKKTKTILLTTIKDHKGQIITDHLWFNYTKGFQKLNLREGVCVQFDARVKPYLKGYGGGYEYEYGQEIDYKLSHPTKITLKTKGETN